MSYHNDKMKAQILEFHIQLKYLEYRETCVQDYLQKKECFRAQSH